MGQLRTFINSVNSQGKHCLFDFSTYISSAYVCTVYMWTVNNINYCFIFDLINEKVYGDYSGYNDSTTISSYCSGSANDIVKTIKITDETITLGEVQTILNEVNSLGHHVLFDTYSLGQDGFYLTTISISGTTLTIFDLVGAKLNSVVFDENLLLVDVMKGAEQVITEYNARILTDLISSVSYRVSVLEGKSETVDWNVVQAKVAQGLGKDSYPVYPQGNTQITVDWERKDSESATTTKYAMPFNVVNHVDKNSIKPIAILDDDWDIKTSIHLSNSTGTDIGTENTHTNHVMYMESHYTLPYGTMFDQSEALLTVGENGLPAGTYYFQVKDNAWCTTDNDKYIQFTLPQALTSGQQLRPTQAYNATMVGATMAVYNDGKDTTNRVTGIVMSEGQEGTFLGSMWGTDFTQSLVDNGNVLIENGRILNHCHRVIMGYNRWSQSGLRQFLNSEGFDWWESMNIWDRAPSYQAYRGYLSGLSSELKAIIKPIRRWNKLNSITDGALFEYTYDKVFLHTPYERYCSGNGDHEGSCERWAWYKSLLDTWNEEQGTTLTQFANWQTYPILKRYRIDAQSSSQTYWSSSDYPSSASYVWCVTSDGTVNDFNAANGFCCLPCFVITL